MPIAAVASRNRPPDRRSTCTPGPLPHASSVQITTSCDAVAIEVRREHARATDRQPQAQVVGGHEPPAAIVAPGTRQRRQPIHAQGSLVTTRSGYGSPSRSTNVARRPRPNGSSTPISAETWRGSAVREAHPQLVVLELRAAGRADRAVGIDVSVAVDIRGGATVAVVPRQRVGRGRHEPAPAIAQHPAALRCAGRAARRPSRLHRDRGSSRRSSAWGQADRRSSPTSAKRTPFAAAPSIGRRGHVPAIPTTTGVSAGGAVGPGRRVPRARGLARR